jgi:hypothetical protein
VRPKLHVAKLLSSVFIKAAVIFVISFFHARCASAQIFFEEKSWLFEAGGSIGAMNALPDVGGRRGRGTRGVKDFNIKNSHPCGSIYVAAGYLNSLIIRLEGTFGKVSAYDSILEKVKKSNAVGRYSRNLHFRSYIAEVALLGEFHPSSILGLYNENSFFASLSPYFMAGLTYYHFNPQTSLNSKWIDLQPLHTEGQGFEEYPTRKNYKLYQFNFPVGAGFRYEVSSNLNFRFEGLFRISNTDYLDDVSTRYIDPALFSKYLTGENLTNALILNNRVRPGTPDPETTARPGGIRGHPNNNDHYFTVNIKLGYVFGQNGNGVGMSKKSKNQLRCPKVF